MEVWEELSKEIDVPDLKRMDKVLHFDNVDSTLAEHSTNTSGATYDILITWFNKQNSPEEAFVGLGEALIHPDVGLNLVAGEVLGYPFQQTSSSSGEPVFYQ